MIEELPHSCRSLCICISPHGIRALISWKGNRRFVRKTGLESSTDAGPLSGYTKDSNAGKNNKIYFAIKKISDKFAAETKKRSRSSTE